jgi:hypothetical protein
MKCLVDEANRRLETEELLMTEATQMAGDIPIKVNRLESSFYKIGISFNSKPASSKEEIFFQALKEKRAIRKNRIAAWQEQQQ